MMPRTIGWFVLTIVILPLALLSHVLLRPIIAITEVISEIRWRRHVARLPSAP